jgi:hypothetical protein
MCWVRRPNPCPHNGIDWDHAVGSQPCGRWVGAGMRDVHLGGQRRRRTYTAAVQRTHAHNAFLAPRASRWSLHSSRGTISRPSAINTHDTRACPHLQGGRKVNCRTVVCRPLTDILQRREVRGGGRQGMSASGSVCSRWRSYILLFSHNV